MATGSYFILLRKIKDCEKNKINEYQIKKFKNEYIKNDDIFKKVSDLTKINEFHKYPLIVKFDIDDETYKWCSIKTGLIYDEIFKFNFISGYNVLRDKFNMDSFLNNEIIIDLNLAKELNIAINYLLSRDYSLKIEDILNNNYIRKFGELLPSYQNFLNKDEYKYDDFEEEGRYFLKKSRMLFETYIWMENENSLNDIEYKLIYHV